MSNSIRSSLVPAVLYPTTVGVGVWLAATGLVWFLELPFLGAVLLGGAILQALLCLHWHARWKKTSLSFRPGQIVFETGGLGTRSVTELAISNVTHLGHELPIVEAMLFGSGRIRIESAGSGAAEIDLPHVADPRGSFQRVLEAMAEGGVPLLPDGMMADESPAMSGVLLNVIGQVLMGFFGVWVMVMGIPNSLLASLAGLIGLGGLTLFVVITAVDARSQRCALFEGNVAFYGGLPERTTLIPMGNIADSRVVQGLIDRIMGLWTVRVSCQGAGNEISMHSLPGGEGFSTQLCRHLQSYQSRAPEPLPEASRASTEGPPLRKRPPADRDRKFSAVYRMNPARNSLLPLLAFLGMGLVAILFAGLGGFETQDAGDAFGGILMLTLGAGAVLGWSLVEAFFTTFEVGPNEVSEDFQFFTRRTKRFSFDKVTAIQIVRGPVDRLMGTLTIKIYSIGSAEEIALKSIPFQQDLEALFLTKIGIPPQDPVLSLNSQFSLGQMWLAQPGWIFFVLGFLGCAGGLLHSPLVASLTAGLLLLLALPGVAYQVLFHRTCRLHYFENSVLFESGVLIRERTHVTFENVKDLTAIRYPFSRMGELRVDIAGEKIDPAQQQNGARVMGIKPTIPLASNGFRMAFLPEVMQESHFFDALQIEHPPREAFLDLRTRIATEAPPRPLQEIRPLLLRRLAPSLLAAMAAVMGGAALTAYQVLPLGLTALGAVVLLLALGLHKLYVESIRYTLEPGVLVRVHGLIYSARTSITFDQVDFVNVSQGILDQIFGTGSVQIHTTGSSKAELVMDAMKGHEAFGDRVREECRRANEAR